MVADTVKYWMKYTVDYQVGLISKDEISAKGVIIQYVGKYWF